MEENVALDSSKQKKFVKSIKGIKKLISKQDKTVEAKKPVSPKVKDGKVKKKRSDRGLVYLSHIPHGFYEHQMTEYFKQFGGVTNARVIRSKRTGRSKGHAFVEFRDPAVAEIVAETMNNYLMGKRLIKAACIPPEKQKRHARRKHWNSINNPTAIARLKLKKAFNANKNEVGDLKKARKLMSNIQKTKKKLSELGINYDFFTPVDIPQALIKNENEDTVVAKKEDEVKLVIKKRNKTDKDSKLNDDKLEVKPKNETVKVKTADKKEIKVKKSKRAEMQEIIVNKTEQKIKKKKLNESGVQPIENFFRIQQESDNDSDSSYEFDSDEYDKMLENDENNSDVSDDDDDDDVSDKVTDDDNESDGDSEEDSVVDTPPKKVISKPALKQAGPVQPKNRKHSNQQEVRKINTEEIKRKAPQSASVSQKKAKFEKQNKQKPMKKQFKKK